MPGYRFTKYIPQKQYNSTFEKLLDLFLELLVYTAGDAEEAIDWMKELDKEYQLSEDGYNMDDFIEDLKKEGYLNDDGSSNMEIQITPKTEQVIRQRSLEDVFGKLKKSKSGNHSTNYSGIGDEPTSNLRDFRYGDAPENIAMTESMRNAQINHGLDSFAMTEDDLEVQETEYKTQTSTVLMIDISHSMILYGEDRITPAKKVAMALSELITTRYPKDTLDVIVFGDDAWQIKIKDLPYLNVGPYHTNTVAGLELAMDILRRRKNNNKQIFMITDGKPTCMKEGGRYYQNSMGFDRRIINKTLNLGRYCRKLDILVTTFMVARDPYLQKFVQDFTQANNGKAFYTSLEGLGEFVFEDYERNRSKRVR